MHKLTLREIKERLASGYVSTEDVELLIQHIENPSRRQQYEVIQHHNRWAVRCVGSLPMINVWEGDRIGCDEYAKFLNDRERGQAMRYYFLTYEWKKGKSSGRDNMATMKHPIQWLRDIGSLSRDPEIERILLFWTEITEEEFDLYFSDKPDRKLVTD